MQWKVSHNASRSGIRLVGPVPKWARKDGGEGGAHPSNLIEYGYPLGTLNWTGDDPCIFPVDCPNLGGFVSSTTVIRADWWKLGQVKAGNTLRYVRVGLNDALNRRKKMQSFLDAIEDAIDTGAGWEKIDKMQGSPGCHVDFHNDEFGKAVIWEKEGNGHVPRVRYRQVSRCSKWHTPANLQPGYRTSSRVWTALPRSCDLTSATFEMELELTYYRVAITSYWSSTGTKTST
jgi:hypothetical protein